MNILGFVFPASFLQQSDQQQISEINDAKTKCSDVGHISTNLKNRTKEASEGVKYQEKLVYNRSNKKASDDRVELPRHPSDVNVSAGVFSNSPTLDEPTKRTSKKKKKKKAKLNKMTLDNDADPESAGFDSLTCPSIQSGSKEIARRTVQTEPNQTSAILSYKSSKELIDNSVENKSGAKGNSTCSQSTHMSEGSKHLSDGGDIESFSSINKVSSEIAVLQDSAFGHNKVDKIRNTKLASKQDKNSERVSGSADVITVTACEPMGAYLQDARGSETKLSTKFTPHDNSDLMGSHILPLHGDQKSTGTCENSSNLADCTAEWNQEATGTSTSVDCMGHDTTDLMVLGVKEVGRDDNNEEVKSRNQCSVLTDAPTAAPTQAVEHDKGHSQTVNGGLSRIPSRATNHNQFGKENSHFNWQKTWKNSGGLQNSGRKIYNHEHLWMDPHSPAQLRNNSGNDGLLPPPRLSYTGRDDLRQRAKKSGIGGHEMLGTRRHVLVEPPEWVVRQRFHSRFGQYVSRSNEDDFLGNMTSARSMDRQNQPLKQENANYCKRGVWMSKANLSNHQNRSNFVLRKGLEVPRAMNLHRTNISGQRSSHDNHHEKSDYLETHELECLPSFFAPSSHVQLHEPWTPLSGHHKLLHEIQPHVGANIATTVDINGEACHASLAEDDTSSACFEMDFTYNNNFKECINSRVILQKWVPVCKKESLMVKNNIDIDANNIRKGNANQEIDIVSVCEAANVTSTSNGMKQFDGLSNGIQVNCVGEGKNDHFASDYKSRKTSMYIGSEMAVQTLDAAFGALIASDRVQLATGSPIAEFEKLLYSASPVIVPSFAQQQCEDILTYHPISSSSTEFQNPTLLLGDVWTWYEGPGNYGLEVKAEDSQNPEGLETNVASFSAHFVPFLSAVQLFGRSHDSQVCSIPSHLITTDVREETEQCSFVSETTVSNLKSGKTYTRHSELTTTDENGYSNSSSALCSSDDFEVIFEYFEREPPQQRKPLYEKIKELVEGGASNPQLYGDPSNLERMNLQDLHPTSWYSVAWYPIYRIPEGSFRASFLTYHSLGNLALRRNKSGSMDKNAFCVVSPVLGLQSYNAQGECWFYPTKPAESLSKDGMPFNGHEILPERLRTLEETAALFARGCVRKGRVHASNRHPDYEFFLSRKQ